MKWILLMKSSSHAAALENDTIQTVLASIYEKASASDGANSCNCVSQINWHRFPYLLLFPCFFQTRQPAQLHRWITAQCCHAQQKSAEKKEVAPALYTSSPSLISPNYQRVCKQSDTTDLLSESCGHDWKALPAYYDRSVMVMEGKSALW